jgi:hypothetical protein
LNKTTDYSSQHYNHLAHTQKEAAVAEYKRWIESHTRAEIKLANTARRALRSRGIYKPSHAFCRLIEDEREPKRPLSPFVLFSMSRNQSGDFKHIAVTERAKLIGQEWRALSEDEKAVSLRGP